MREYSFDIHFYDFFLFWKILKIGWLKAPEYALGKFSAMMKVQTTQEDSRNYFSSKSTERLHMYTTYESG